MEIGLAGEARKIYSFRPPHVFEMATEVATVGERTVRRSLARRLGEGRLPVKKHD